MIKTLILSFCIFISAITIGQKQVTLEDIWLNYEFYPSGVNGFKSMNDGEHYTTTNNKENRIKIFKNSYETGKVVDTIMDSDDIRLKKMRNYTFNKSEDKILIATNTQSIYRYSTKSVYYIFNIKTKELSNLSKNNVMYNFSPNGKNIAYVFNNNLYVYNLLTGITNKLHLMGLKIIL